MPSILVTMCLIHKMKHIFPPIRNTAQKTPEQAPGADGYIDIVPDEHSSTPDVVDAPADVLGVVIQNGIPIVKLSYCCKII